MKSAIALISSFALFATASLLGEAHTPPPGAEERKAICDALRAFVLRHVATRPPPQPIVFKVNFLRVDGDIAWFEGIPMLKNGGFATDFLPDVDYVMVLRNASGHWRVIHDLSRSDVPSEAELAGLRKELADVPASVIPNDWLRLLRRMGR